MATIRLQKTQLSGMLALCLALVASVFSLGTLAADMAGNVIRAKGDVTAKGAEQRNLGAGDAIMEGDTIITGPNSGAQLQMKDGAIIAIAADSVLVISSYNFNEPDGQEDGVRMILKQGNLRTITGDTEKDKYVLETPSALVRIQGTVYDTQVAPNGGSTTAILREGAIVIESTCEGQGSGNQQLIDVPGMATAVTPCEEPQLTNGFDVAALDALLPLATAAGTTGGPGAPPPPPPAPPSSGNTSP